MKPTLKIQNIMPDLGFVTMVTSSDNIIRIIEYIRTEMLQIDFDVFLPTIGKNLQRGFVWDNMQKSEYILSILRTYNKTNGISSQQPICIIRNEWFSNNGKQYWQIIDGKQRLSTILDFVDNKIPFEWNGFEYYYVDLDVIMQGVINRFWFNMVYAVNYEKEPITDLQKIEWFRTVNFLGTPQDKEHLKNLYEQN